MQVQGFRSRVRIRRYQSGQIVATGFFAVKSWSMTDEVEALEVTNTEGRRGGGGGSDGGIGSSAINNGAGGGIGEVGWQPAGYKSVTPGPAGAKIELATATFIDDAAANPFTNNAFSFESAIYMDVKIYPNKFSLRGHYFPYAMITSIKHEAEVGGLQPVSLTFESDGDYALYTLESN